jgi:hypothetical protein
MRRARWQSPLERDRIFFEAREIADARRLYLGEVTALIGAVNG